MRHDAAGRAEGEPALRAWPARAIDSQAVREAIPMMDINLRRSRGPVVGALYHAPGAIARP